MMTEFKKACKVMLSLKVLRTVLLNKESDGSTKDSNQAIWKKGILLVPKIFNDNLRSDSINLIFSEFALRVHNEKILF